MTSTGKLVKLVCAGSLLFASFTAVGQSSTDGTLIINGGRNVLRQKPLAQKATPATPATPGLVKIYSTLGTGSHVYSVLSGIGILGTDTGQLFPEMVANGFRPKADHVVTEIQVGVWHYQGTNALAVSLNQDNHGVPGKALHSWHFSNLPVMWSCCTLQTAKYTKGIAVKKGKSYWVVLSPEKQFQDTWDTWADNVAGKSGRMWANNNGSGWNTGYEVLSAVGVFGK